MISGLLLLLFILSFLWLIGKFSQRSKRAEQKLKNIILKKIEQIKNFLPYSGRKILIDIFVGLWLLAWLLKQRFLG